MRIKDITVQWSIIAEALHQSIHHKGPHSMGLMLGKGSGNISVHHNLLSHNNQRNPRIKTSGGSGSVIDFINNVIYNFGGAAGLFSDDFGRIQVNYVGNVIKEGPNSTSICDIGLKFEEHGGDFAIYAHDNVRLRRDGTQLPLNICGEDSEDIVSSPHPAPTVTVDPPLDAYEMVLAGAGAILPRRDSVDERIVEEVSRGTGRIIDDPSDTCPWPDCWPVLQSDTPPPDADGDGMPDEWEELYRFNPHDPSDGPQDADRDGYTNVEEYLNGTFPVPPAQPRVLGVEVPSGGGAYFDEDVVFRSSYGISTAFGDIGEVRLLVSNELGEGDSQFYGVVVQESPGVFRAYLHDGFSRWPTTADVPGDGWLGGHIIGVGEPLHDGAFIGNRWVRWNVGESYVVVNDESNTVEVYWDVLFRPFYYGVQLDQRVYSYVSSIHGEEDRSGDAHEGYGWHGLGRWAVRGYGTFVRNPSFEFDAVGEGVPVLWSRSYGTPRGTLFYLVEDESTDGTRSVMVETVPAGVEGYYQGLMQGAYSPGFGVSMEFRCDLHVVRGTVVINLFTWYWRKGTFWLGSAVVDANGGFERVGIRFSTPDEEHFHWIYYSIDGIQSPGGDSATLFYVDNVNLEVEGGSE
jgi:hypothetical protein